jgi:ABC-type polysaccharide/polyol phosphate export permease
VRSDCVSYSSSQELSWYRGIWEQLVALRDFRHVVYNLVVGRVTRRYHGTALGLLWSLLNPLFYLVALAVVFPHFMRVQVEGYVVYLVSGLVAWGFVANVINGGNDVIYHSASLLRQVRLPAVIFPLVVTITELVNMLFTLVALHLVIWVIGYPPQTDVVYLAAAIAVTFVFLFGVIGLVNVLIVYFRDVQHMLQNVMQGMFFVSAVFFPVEAIPQGYRWLMEWNPFYQYIRLYHFAIYQPAQTSWEWFLVPTALAVASMVVMLWAFSRYGRLMIYRL